MISIISQSSSPTSDAEPMRKRSRESGNQHQSMNIKLGFLLNPKTLAHFLATTFLCLGSLIVRADEKTLTIAQELATNDFAGFQYGSNGIKRKQIDCVQFMLAVVEKRLGTVKYSTKNDIKIAHGWTPDEEQLKAEEGTDENLAGVQKALVDAGKGVAVEKADVKPGDLIQYWMKLKDGKWFGHAAVVKSVDSNIVTLFGAHQSKGGIADLKLDLDKATRVYLVRIRPTD